MLRMIKDHPILAAVVMICVFGLPSLLVAIGVILLLSEKDKQQ